MKISDWLSKEELTQFTCRNNARAAIVLAQNWLFIVAIFAVAAYWTHPITVVLGTLLLGGRQMGLASLMHETGHGTFFRSPWLNRWVGQWLCAYPLLGDMQDYATAHREHHRLAGTADDPDLPNYRSYPVAKSSFRRKLTRDLSGQTGLRMLAAVFSGGMSNMGLRSGEHLSSLSKGLSSSQPFHWHPLR